MGRLVLLMCCINIFKSLSSQSQSIQSYSYSYHLQASSAERSATGCTIKLNKGSSNDEDDDMVVDDDDDDMRLFYVYASLCRII